MDHGDNAGLDSTVIHRVIFVCRQNSRRSQMAHGLLGARASGGLAVFSAGLDGAGGLASEAITVMEEQGIDLRGHSSNTLQEYEPEQFRAVIVLCGCLPELPSAWQQRPLVEDWDIPDPIAGDLESHRRARDLITGRIDGLLQQLTG
jgi:arsenate reductase